MKSIFKFSALFLFAISCVVTTGCGGGEEAAPAPSTTSSPSDDTTEKADGSGTKPAESDGSGSK